MGLKIVHPNDSTHRATSIPAPYTAGRPEFRRAFTLFELVLVVLIIGIAAAAIVPAIGNNLHSSELSTAANMLASDIDFCASTCISQPEAPCAITFDTTHNQYSVIDVNSGGVLTAPMDGLPYVNDFATGRNAQIAGVTITGLVMGSGTLTSLTFDPYGKPVTTADFVITLTYNGQSMSVTVSHLTGDVSISG
jgi:prepilin-type N-terminal cleavage/methylation domain-containing protein